MDEVRNKSKKPKKHLERVALVGDFYSGKACLLVDLMVNVQQQGEDMSLSSYCFVKRLREMITQKTVTLPNGQQTVVPVFYIDDPKLPEKERKKEVMAVLDLREVIKMIEIIKDVIDANKKGIPYNEFKEYLCRFYGMKPVMRKNNSGEVKPTDTLKIDFKRPNSKVITFIINPPDETKDTKNFQFIGIGFQITVPHESEEGKKVRSYSFLLREPIEVIVLQKIFETTLNEVLKRNIELGFRRLEKRLEKQQALQKERRETPSEEIPPEISLDEFPVEREEEGIEVAYEEIPVDEFPAESEIHFAEDIPEPEKPSPSPVVTSSGKQGQETHTSSAQKHSRFNVKEKQYSDSGQKYSGFGTKKKQFS